MSDADEFFPDSQRVIYTTSPLREVVCELRFPTILRIDNPAPAEFQEEIRSQFPLFEKQAGLPPGLQLPPEIANIIAAQNQPFYRFATETSEQFVSLTNSSISLTSRKYNRWENYSSDLKVVIDAFVRIYRPSFFVRVGLRYQNLINPLELPEGIRSWGSLLNSNIAAEFGAALPSPVLITEAQRATRFVNPNSGEGVFLQHGIGRLQDQASDAYIIDIDCYADTRTGANDALPILSRLNSRARRAFRWCIADELHRALRPTSLDGSISS